LIWLRLDSSGALVEEKFPASPTSYPASPTTCRTVVYKVTATELFTPYDALGHDLTGESLGTSPTVGSGCQPLPSTVPSKINKPDTTVIGNLEAVASVTISFTSWDNGNAHPLSSSLAQPSDRGRCLMTTHWLDRRRDHAASDESGFMLIYVLMVISIVTVLVGSVLLVTGNSLLPAVQASYNQAVIRRTGRHQRVRRLRGHELLRPELSRKQLLAADELSGTQTIYSASGYTSTYSW